MAKTIGGYRAGFAAACAALTSVGIGSAVFFRLPSAASGPVELIVVAPFLAIAYFALLRYDFEAEQLIAAGEVADAPLKLAVLRPSTAIRMAALGDISLRTARTMLGVAAAVFLAGLAVGLILIATDSS